MIVPHEYGPSRVGHGEAQCKWCLGTNRENAIIAPNHCAVRAEKDIPTPPAPEGEDVEALVNLADTFADWLARGPNEQPAFSNGWRPFSTGDLKHYERALRNNIATLSQRPAPQAGSGLAEELAKLIANSATGQIVMQGALARKILAALPNREAIRREERELLRQAMNLLGVVADNADPHEQVANNGMTVWDCLRTESERLLPRYRNLADPDIIHRRGEEAKDG